MIIGIDPDIRKPGVCVMQYDGSFVFKSCSMSELLSMCKTLIDTGCVIAIENVNLNAATYARRSVKNAAANTKVSQNVGMCKAAQTILCDYVEYLGGKVLLAPPGLGKRLGVKEDAKRFAALSGYDGRSNADQRDAWAIAKWANESLQSHTKQ